MTEMIAAPPNVKPIHHWIGGRIVAGTSGRSGPVFNPATGEQTGAVDLASVDEVDAAVAAAKAAFPSWRATSLSRRAEIMFRMRELLHQHRKEIAPLLTAEHGKVLSDALGEVARGLENIEFACGIPQPAQGRLLRAGLDRRRRVLDPPAARRRGRASRRSTSRRWCRCGCSPTRSPAATRSSSSRPRRTRRRRCFMAELLQAGRPAGRRASTSSRATRSRSTRSSTTPTSRPSSFVGSTPIAKYIYETGTANGKRVQALGGAKNHMLVLPDADIDMAADAAVSRRLRLGRRALHGDQRRARRRRASPTRSSRRSPSGIPNVKVGAGHEPGNRDGPAGHRASTATRSPRYLDRRAEQGATRRRRRARAAVCRRRASSSAPRSSTTSRPSMDCYRDEIFGPVLTVVRVAGYEEGVGADQRQPVRQRHGDLHPRRWRRPPVPVRRPGRHGRHQRADPGAGRYYRFGGWKASLFGDPHMYGPEGINFYTRGKVVTSRWPDPAHQHGRPRASRGRASARLAGTGRTGRQGRRRRRLTRAMSVTICDVGPRDGLQNEAEVLAPAVRAELCGRLAAAGVPRIEAVSFVRGDLVPQMDGAEEAAAALTSDRLKPVTAVYAGLVLNERGYERLATAGLDEAHLTLGATETFNRRKREPVDRGIDRGLRADRRAGPRRPPARDGDHQRGVRLPVRGRGRPGPGAGHRSAIGLR